MRIAISLSLVLVTMSFLTGMLFLHQLPEEVAIHWNVAGEADGFAPALLAVLIMPVVSLLLLGLFIAIPKIDPLRKNLEKFLPYFDGFIIVMMSLLFYVHAISIALNTGAMFNIMQAISPAIGLMFFYIGIMLDKTRRNWFLGIRNPWTLSSDIVWKKTHVIGGKLFKIAGLIALAGIAMPDHVLWLILVPVLAVVVYVNVYSYIEYRKVS